MPRLFGPNQQDPNALDLRRNRRVRDCAGRSRFAIMILNSPVATSVKSHPQRIAIRYMLRREPANPADGSLFTGTAAGDVSTVESFSDGSIAPNVARWGNVLAVRWFGDNIDVLREMNVFIPTCRERYAVPGFYFNSTRLGKSSPTRGIGFPFFCSINPRRKP